MPGERGQVFANVSCPGAGVHGVLYCCSADALRRLDEFERGYERRRVLVVPENGDPREAFIYIAGPAGVVEGGTPSAEYLHRILTGARQRSMLNLDRRLRIGDLDVESVIQCKRILRVSHRALAIADRDSDVGFTGDGVGDVVGGRVNSVRGIPRTRGKRQG